MARKDNYQLLIEKLDQFIRKYYINQLLRGLLYSIGLVLFLFLTVNVLEHLYYFNQAVRKTLFYSFLAISIFAFGGWVIMPALRYFRLGPVISHEKAAQIIGQHFQLVKDKLLNILQLKEQSESQANKALILASINRKSDQIRPVPFQAAIDLTQNRKYLRYALPPLLILLILLWAAPSVIKDSTRRLINNNTDFERPAPFQFILTEENPQVVQYQDYALQVDIQGEQLPNEAFIEVDGAQYRLSQEDPNTFTYRFSNVQEDLEFRLFSAGVSSKRFTLEVLQKPNIIGFDVNLNFPKYTKRKDEELRNIGDLVVPEGTTINWVFQAENTDDIRIRFNSVGEVQNANRFSNELFTFKALAKNDDSYKVFVSNTVLPNADSIRYALSIIPDYYPEISVEAIIDSSDNKLVYFVGEASDDYGLRSLSFNYQISKEDGSEGDVQTERILEPLTSQVQYDYLFDLNTIPLEPGDQVTYYFEVYDNDGVNGSKSARTGTMVYATPSLEELEAMAEANDETIKENLRKAVEESKEVQEEMEKLREKLLQEREMDWQSRQELEKLLNRQQELQKQIEEARKAFDENRKTEEELQQSEPETREKQEKLDEMFDQAMNEEMQRLMEQIQQMLQELDKDQALKMMEQMESDSENRQMELERLEELFKQLELEQEVNKAIDKMEELAEQQEKLGEQMMEEESQDALEEEQSESDEQNEEQSQQEQLEQQQEEIQKEFEELMEKMEEIQQKNEELESPQSVPDNKEQMEDVKQSMQEKMQQLQHNQNQKAGEKSKETSQKMEQMAQQMQQNM
ncbi:MAG: DUF4175 domain-containing protein, partial [Saprospiraceae bacterium]|nr:DUF4175 domain-containing protein [Saprospiraceae bacterium]